MDQKPIQRTNRRVKGIIAGALLIGSLAGVAPPAIAASQDLTPERCYPWNFPRGCFY